MLRHASAPSSTSVLAASLTAFPSSKLILFAVSNDQNLFFTYGNGHNRSHVSSTFSQPRLPPSPNQANLDNRSNLTHK